MRITKVNDKRIKTTVVVGRIFKVYFESMYDVPLTPENMKAALNRTTACMVVADTTEEAIAKIHAAFPGEQINMVAGEDPHRYLSGEGPHKRPRGETIVF